MATDPDLQARTPAQKPRGAQVPRALRGILESYFAHHAKMAKDSALRLTGAPFASAMTWAVMGIALALPVGLLLLLLTLRQVGDGWEAAARINVYLQDQASQADAKRLQALLEKRPAIAAVEWIDKAAALADFRQTSGLGSALDYLQDNPLPHSLVITPKRQYRDAAALQILIGTLETLPEVAQVQLDLAWLQRLQQLTALLTRIVWALAMLFGVAVLLVIGNTIRLAIESRRDEILVVKLVGGTDAFVRRPFLYTGIWYGMGGGLIAIALIQSAVVWLDGPVKSLAALYGSHFALVGLSFGRALFLLLAALLLGWLGAWLAVKRHLGAIEPS